VQEQYLGSLRGIGITSDDHDLRFVEDDWESPTLGAWGLGWEVWCDGMEVTQFTYFQQAGGFECRPVSAELTYGLERIAMYLQGADDCAKLYLATRARMKFPSLADRALAEKELARHAELLADQPVRGGPAEPRRAERR